ncbi:hypothetical protein HWC29_gp056 [Aeromonas phage 4_4572]|uniref:Uncharacterized protein n=1 Tax=Aeromonas phage 4_4572 TaxID=2588517 RepID=A0A5B9NAR3_9CAUD|nr:hypothetical protein HWC29_gp056 [Aeromonas phage 4_4572]QEG09130.1 hypothetical protein [Aeromonas phage 4_4572]
MDDKLSKKRQEDAKKAWDKRVEGHTSPKKKE